MALEPHTHKDLREKIDDLRKEHNSDIDKVCKDVSDLGKKIDDQSERWFDWSEKQTGKLDEFRSDIQAMVSSVRGAVEQKEALDSTLMAIVQRIEKQFDQFSQARERDLKETYTMAAKQEAHEKDITAAHTRVRTLDQKVDKLTADLPAIISKAVKAAFNERESAAFKKTIGWVAGIIAAVVAEYFILKLSRGG